MTITNEDRYTLQKRANETFGPKEGATLMELLPPVGWAEVATKSDLDAQTALLRSDFDVKIAGLDNKIAGLDGKIAGLRSDLVAQSSVLQSEFRADLKSGLLELQGKMLTAILTLTGILVTMAGLQVAVLLRT